MNPGNYTQLYSLQTATGALTKITNESEIGDVRSAWDIDANATKIAFVSREDYAGNNPNNSKQVFVANTDGTGFVQLSQSVRANDNVYYVQLSGDGTTVLFNSYADLDGSNPDENNRTWFVNADGTGIRQLGGVFAGEQLALSYDGSKVAFEYYLNPLGNNGDNNREIFVINTDGSDLTQITLTDSGASWEPEISDDGSRIVFVSDAEPVPGGNVDGNYEVYVANTDGSGIVQITSADENSGTEEYSNQLPTPRAVDISGDGNYVLFESNADLTGRGELDFHSLFWATSDGTLIEQQLRPATLPEEADQDTERSYLNYDGSQILIDTREAYFPELSTSSRKLYLMTRQ